MGLFSKSTSVQQTSVANYADNSNTGAQDRALAVSGDLTAAEGATIFQTFTDGGAVEGALSLAGQAVTANSAGVQAIAGGFDTLAASADRGITVLTESAAQQYAAALDFSRDALGFVRASQSEAAQTLSSGFEENARQLSAFAGKVSIDSGERVQATVTTLTRYALAAVSVLVVGFFLTRAKHAS